MNPHHKVVMVPHALIISDLLWFFICYVNSSCYTAVRIKNCSKSMSTIKVASIGWCHTPQLSSETEVPIVLFCQLCSTRYTAVQINSCLKSTSVIEVPSMKNTHNFHYTKEVISCNHQINAFHCKQR